jgi:KDO2-lipid IV(A) lauroyltransferase
MVSYCDLVRLSPEQLQDRVDAGRSMSEWIDRALAGGRGAIVLTAHLGNWEVGARLLELAGRPINVVMHAEWTHPVERWLLRLRQQRMVRVIRVGNALQGTLAVVAALARNEIVAMQGDRVLAGRAIELELFGERFGFPIGPFLMAYRCEAPLLPAFVIQQGWSRWRAEPINPVVFPRTGDRDADLRAGALTYARELERVVRRHPDQWFNFFDLWP